MMMMRKQANLVSNSAVTEETYICSSTQCFYHTKHLSTMEAITSCRRMKTTDFICEHCRSPLIKDIRGVDNAKSSHDDLKARINQQLSGIEGQVQQLVHYLTQERQEQAMQSDSQPISTGTSALTGLESISVHIESGDAKSGAAGPNNTNSAANASRSKAVPWDSGAARDSDLFDILKDEPRHDVVDEGMFQELLRKQEHELHRAAPKPANGTTDNEEIPRENIQQSHSSVATVMIGGRSIPINNITEEMVQALSHDEYQQYIEVMREYGSGDDDEFDI
uniref:Transcription factor TFIIE alpha subunit C-terminal domain-containing protein n=1 Tax=Spongospora subterranea TaxID=70186 RepID=A0A0H5RA55_9EUKA|eukprot:CRZ10968.1 hypothetical protein [Spongospora subterranea]